MKFNCVDSTEIAVCDQIVDGDLCRAIAERLIVQSQQEPSQPRSNPGCWRGRAQLTAEQDRQILSLLTDLSNQYYLSLRRPEHCQEPQDLQWQFSAWANVNSQHSGNLVHLHSESMITLVLYLQSTGTGSIRFHPLNHLMKIAKPHWPYNSDCVYHPQDGDCVIFPSYLLHTVESNPSPRHRVCIAVNADLV